jgi:hypothetical protein
LKLTGAGNIAEKQGPLKLLVLATLKSKKAYQTGRPG